LLCLLIEGGTGRSLTVARAEQLLARVHIDGPITTERIATARQLLDEVRALDAARDAVRQRHVSALEASKTTVTEEFGIDPLTANVSSPRCGAGETQSDPVCFTGQLHPGGCYTLNRFP
jgi:hypothetical protein